MKRLTVDITGKAPVDQLLWSAWGFCVVEHGLDAKLTLVCADASNTTLLPGLSEALEKICGVRVIHQSVAVPSSEEEFVLVSSAGAVSQRLVRFSSSIYVCPVERLTGLAPDWFWTPVWMSGLWRLAERLGARLLKPNEQATLQQQLADLRPAMFKASLISSVFNADDFLRHFLANCCQLKGYPETEHWLIRPASSGYEHEALIDHVRCNRNAIYMNLTEDPGLYDVWNLAAVLAQGRLLSNANIDDRRAPEHLAALTDELYEHGWADLASAKIAVTRKSNQELDPSVHDKLLYENAKGGEYGIHDLFAAPDGRFKARNLPDCMPVWRRSLHFFHGFFRERQYGPSSDWEFWLRCARNGARYTHRDEILGLYLDRKDSYWHGNPEAEAFDLKILDRYIPVHYEALREAPVSGVPLADLTRFVQLHSWLGVMLCLIRCHAVVPRPGSSLGEQGTQPLSLLQRYYGVSGLPTVEMDCLCGDSNSILQKLGPILVGLLNEFWQAGRHFDAIGKNQAVRWKNALIEWHALTGEHWPLAGVARLERIALSNATGEQQILHCLKEMDPQGFSRHTQWCYLRKEALECVSGGIQ